MSDQPDLGSLSAKQQTFVLAMLTSPSIVAAAKETGVAEKTAHQWLKLPHVKEALDDARREVFESSLAELKLAVRLAVKTLTKHLKDDDTPAAAQIRAAQIVIEQAVELYKIGELERKVAELEQLVKE